MSTSVESVDFEHHFATLQAMMELGFAQQQEEIASLRKLLGKKSRSLKSASAGGVKPSRPQQAHQAFIAYAKDTWPEEYEEFCAEFGRTPKVLEGKPHGGGAIMFASKMRGTADEPGPHADEWETFQAAHAERMAAAAADAPEEATSSASSTSTGSKKSRALDPEEKERRALERWLGHEKRGLSIEGTLEELRNRKQAFLDDEEAEKLAKKQARESKKTAKPAPKSAAKSAPAPSSLLSRAAAAQKSTPATAAKKPAPKPTVVVKTPVKTAAAPKSAPPAPLKKSLVKSTPMMEELEAAEEEEAEETTASNSAAATIVTKPFKFKKVKYQVTDDGYAWLEAADGSRGEYAGKIGEDGTFDKEAPNPFE